MARFYHVFLITHQFIDDTHSSDLQETYKNGVPWYECEFNIVAIKDHINIKLSVVNITIGEMSFFEGVC
jgi:hypothetical protein